MKKIFTLISLFAAGAIAFNANAQDATEPDQEPSVSGVEVASVPEAGSTLQEITTIELVFDGEVGYVPNAKIPVATMENLSTGDLWYCAEPVLSDLNDDGQSIYTLEFTELGGTEPVELTELGVYKLSLSGWYLNDGEDFENYDNVLPTMVLEYSIVPEGFVTYVPAAGSTVSEINTVTVTFQGKVRIDDTVRPAPIVLANTTTGDLYYGFNPLLDTKSEEDITNYTVQFYEIDGEMPVVITETGSYLLSIRGAFAGQYEDEDGELENVYLPVFETSYTVMDEDFYSLSPASGSLVSDLSKITVTFSEEVNFVENNRPASAMLENLSTGETYFCYSPKLANSVEGWVYDLTFVSLGDTEPAEITEVGNYQLTIMGAYVGEDEENVLPNITATYSLYPEDYYTLTPEDGAEVEDLSEITLTFNGNPNVGIMDVRPAPVTLENLTTGELWYCENPMKSRLEDGSSSFTLTFSELGGEESVEVTENGEYLLSVRGLYVTVLNDEEVEAEYDLPALVANFYIVNGTTGIENVINSDVYNVYGINGMQLIRNGKASDVNTLKSGLYIINGKKVLIRK